VSARTDEHSGVDADQPIVWQVGRSPGGQSFLRLTVHVDSEG
jgi:hypothetical protein